MARDPTGMDPAFVFGYGSLLARGEGTPCRLRRAPPPLGRGDGQPAHDPGLQVLPRRRGGGRAGRVRGLPRRRAASPEPRCTGLAFPVDAAALGELDARERNYRRVDVTAMRRRRPRRPRVGVPGAGGGARSAVEAGVRGGDRRGLTRVRGGRAGGVRGVRPGLRRREPELPGEGSHARAGRRARERQRRLGREEGERGRSRSRPSRRRGTAARSAHAARTSIRSRSELAARPAPHAPCPAPLTFAGVHPRG